MGILILLHIQVDELRFFHTLCIGIRIINGRLVQLRHTAYQFWEAFFVIQCMSLCIDTRNLYRDIVDVRFFQCLQIRVVTLVGLTVT